MIYRRFGRTELQMPVISCGGMRFQESWKSSDPVTDESQRNLEACVRRAFELGINHFETARGYGTSEAQLGKVLPQLPRDRILVQTKIGPSADVEKFEETFEKSLRLLQLDYVDLFSFHGVNNETCFENTLKCLDSAQRWKREGRVRTIGFSTHGTPENNLRIVQSGMFDYVNLHWYFIYQNNWPVIQEAAARDMGVFIISPNDKGGMLYKPSRKLEELTAPLHPMVFNGLFCLRKPEVHTLSCGVSRREDFDVHMQTVENLDRAEELTAPIAKRLDSEMRDALGEEWVSSWATGLPEWHEIPGEINVQWILRLRNLAVAYDMMDYARMRYNMLGNGGHWFPGNKADALDGHDLSATLRRSRFAEEIPEILRATHRMLAGEEKKRLVQDEA